MPSFGIKATQSWKGKVYSAKTREVYDGNPTYITDTFRAYDSLEDSIADYFNLICKSERYRKALTAETPKEQIEAIKNGGYATDPEYVTLIMNIINGYNLSTYDNKDTKNPYQIGQNYVLQVNLNVRNGAGTYFDKKTFDQLTPNAKLHSLKQKTAILKKGTIVTCQETKQESDNIWIRIPSGWICGVYGGKIYVR